MRSRRSTVVALAGCAGLALSSAARAQFYQFNSSTAGMFTDITGTGSLVVTGDDEVAGVFVSPSVGNAAFPSGTLNVCTNGHAGYQYDNNYLNGTIPSSTFYMGATAAAVFWDDLITNVTGSGVYVQETMESGVPVYIVEWVNMDHYSVTNQHATFELKIFGGTGGPGGALAQYLYQSTTFGVAAYDNGASATVGYQANGTTGVQYSYNMPVITGGLVLTLVPAVTGACCMPDGTCAVNTSGGCAAAFGVYHGDNSSCGSVTCPTGACCLADGSCAVTAAAGCTQRSGVYRGDNSPCGSAGCVPATFTNVALNYNFNGMVHGSGESGPSNLSNPNGYRSISDRGLLIDGQTGSFGTGPIVDTDFIPYTIVTQPGVLDLVHLGNRNLVDNGNWAFSSGPNTGTQPAWLPNPDQTGPQTTSLSRTLTANSAIGVLYNVSNGGGSFDVVLGFSDNTSITVNVSGPDWFGDHTPLAPTPGSGVAAQRELGVFAGTGSVDMAVPDNPLNVTEAVINAASLQAAGRGNIAGRTLTSITFRNPHSFNTAYADPTVGSGFAIYAVTISNSTAGASCYANCDGSTAVPFLNVNDFICFQGRFAAGNTYANCDGSTMPPVLNVNDFICFQGRFAAGCSAP